MGRYVFWIFVLLYSLAAVAEHSPDIYRPSTPQPCVVDGREIPVGGGVKVECNSCQCTGHGLWCTELACAGQPSSEPVDEPSWLERAIQEIDLPPPLTELGDTLDEAIDETEQP